MPAVRRNSSTADPLELVVVHGKTLDEELTQSLGSPGAKLGVPMGLYPVTDGNNHIEVEIIDLIAVCHQRQLLPNLQQLISVPVPLR